jgi:hypothetical protein
LAHSRTRNSRIQWSRSVNLSNGTLESRYSTIWTANNLRDLRRTDTAMYRRLKSNALREELCKGYRRSSTSLFCDFVLYTFRLCSSAFYFITFSTEFIADRPETRTNANKSNEIRISRTSLTSSRRTPRDLPGCPEVTINELHRHLTINDLDDVHRGARCKPNRRGTLHWWRVYGACDFRCAGDIRDLSKPFVSTCVCVSTRASRERKG